MSDTILTDALVLTMDGERTVEAPGYVWIRDGAIHEVGPTAELGAAPEGADVRPLRGHVVMPGLINTHTHLSMSLLRGIFDELPLELWMEHDILWNSRRAMLGNADAAAAGAALSLLELMRGGVTTTEVGEMGVPNPEWPDGVLEATTRAGARTVLSRMTMDSDDAGTWTVPPDLREPPARAVAELERLRRAWRSDLVEIGPFALGPLWCTESMIRTLHEFAVDANVHLDMHISNSRGEEEDARARLGRSTVAHVARLGALGPKTLLAHAIWLDDDDVGLLAEHGAGVAHTPVADAHYAVGVARIPELLAAGVRVGLGVDGANTNNGLDLWESAKLAIFLQKLRLEDATYGSAQLALELLTIGGARALHMEDEIGSLEPGKRADVICVDTSRVSLAPRTNLVSNLVYSHDAGAVRHVFVDGVERVRDGVHLTLDEGEVVEAAQSAAERMLRGSPLRPLFEQRLAVAAAIS